MRVIIFIRKVTKMISEVEAEKINQWLIKFQKEHGDKMVLNDDVIRDLACSLCDDNPLGYEASHRLANWLFCYLNMPKISGKLLENLQRMAEHQKDAEERLGEAFDDYKRYAYDFMRTFKVLNEDE